VAPEAWTRPGDVDAALAAAGLPALPRTAWLAIDLDRLVGNLAAIRAALPPGVRIEPVVKADAYGHGAVAVSHALAAAGADGLSVSTADEAFELRDAGIEAPILVLYPVPPALVVDVARRRIAVTIGDELLLERTLAAVALAPRSTPALEVQLEVETGLGRGGLPVDRVVPAARALAASTGVRLAGAWSHLGSPGDPVRTRSQLRAFEAAAGLAGAAGIVVRPWHVAATGSLLAGVSPLYDAVRPGLAIYGLVPEGLEPAAGRAELAAALRPVLSLHARPVRVADLPIGTTISYGSAFVTARPSRIATLPVGYADGYSRARSGRASVLVRGRRVPLVGTIAMDAVMADVTEVPGPPVTLDDAFVLIGEQGGEAISAAGLAHAGNSISWEVLSGMARRLPRVYYAAAGPVELRTLTEGLGQWRRSTR
jgi:alanine racemase